MSHPQIPLACQPAPDLADYLAIGNCRSLPDLRLEPGRLMPITGPNDSANSNPYREPLLRAKANLHPNLLPALARPIQTTSNSTQVWALSHAIRLRHELRDHPASEQDDLEKSVVKTLKRGQGQMM